MSEETKSIKSTIQKFGKKLFGFIRGKVRSNEDAEDILQDVWFQFSSFGNIEEIENVSAWLYKVARNKVVDRYRKITPEALDDFEYEGEEGELHFKDILLLDETNNPEMHLFKETFWNELQLALGELPKNQSEVFVLNEIEDLTLQEIADLKGENLKTIISRKGYAVKHLRNRLNYLYKELNY